MRSPSFTAQCKRRQSGSAIAEFAPCLGVLLFLVFFPVVNLMSVTFSYGCGWYLNYLQTREAAITAKVRQGEIRNRSTISAVLQQVRQDWSRTGLGRFTHASDTSERFLLTAEVPNIDRALTVTTNVTVSPLLIVPFPARVPGLNAPVAFSYRAQRQVENLLY
jgi:hypothetical protein